MNELIKVFEKHGLGMVRVVRENSGKILFCGNDIAKSLGYTRPNDAITAHCRCTVKRSIPHPQNLNKTIEMNFITEGDIYRLMARSNLPDADKFESWIFDEVLPTIRETGGYVNNEDNFIDIYLPFADDSTKAMFKTTLDVVRKQNELIASQQKTIEEQKPMVDFVNHVTDSSDAIDIGELAKLANKENIKIGRNRLFQYLRDKKILMNNNEPYQKYIENKWFKTVETTKQTSYGTKIFIKTLVLGKGQVGIIEMLRKAFGEQV